MNIEELNIAATYGQQVIVRLKDGDKILGKAEVSSVSDHAKIRTIEGAVWVPLADIENVERSVKMH